MMLYSYDTECAMKFTDNEVKILHEVEQNKYGLYGTFISSLWICMTEAEVDVMHITIRYIKDTYEATRAISDSPLFRSSAIF